LSSSVCFSQQQKNILTLETGLFRLSDRKFNLITPHNVRFEHPYNFNLGLSYKRRIRETHFLYGFTLGIIRVSRDLYDLEYPYNNPEREPLPHVSISLRQNLLYAIPFIAYQPEIGKKFSLSFQVGLGYYYQLYPKTESLIGFVDPQQVPDTHISYSINESVNRFGPFANMKTGINYRINKRSGIGLTFTLYCAVTLWQYSNIMPIVTHLKVNNANYSTDNRYFLNGHSINISYSYAF